MTKDQEIAELKAMIEADKGHLATELERGNVVLAHKCVDSIIDLQRGLEDLLAE